MTMSLLDFYEMGHKPYHGQLQSVWGESLASICAGFLLDGRQQDQDVRRLLTPRVLRADALWSGSSFEQLPGYKLSDSWLRSGKEYGLEAPSASSTLNFGVQSLQFRSGIVDFELPIDAALLSVGLIGPALDLRLE